MVQVVELLYFNSLMTTSKLDLLVEEPLTLQLTASDEAKIQGEGYNLLEKLGEGSYAKVYRAEYRPHGRSSKVRLACKVYDRDKVPRDIEYTFLPRELDVLMRLDPGHPHIIHIHSIFQRRAKVFIFMEYVQNGELLDYIRKHGPVAEKQARIWFRQLILALQYLHALDIVHRDVTCQNILISANHNLKIVDFGFSRMVVDHQGRRVLSETYCGSPAYAAPEVLRAMPYDPKASDVWSCGIVLYIMLNKAMPFDHTNMRRLVKHQLKKKWKFRRSVQSSVSVQVTALTMQLLEPKVTRRLDVQQILESEWIAMDPRLVGMSEVESRALEAATAVGRSSHSTSSLVNLINLKNGEMHASAGRRRSIGSYSSIGGGRGLRYDSVPLTSGKHEKRPHPSAVDSAVEIEQIKKYSPHKSGKTKSEIIEKIPSGVGLLPKTGAVVPARHEDRPHTSPTTRKVLGTELVHKDSPYMHDVTGQPPSDKINDNSFDLGILPDTGVKKPHKDNEAIENNVLDVDTTSTARKDDRMEEQKRESGMFHRWPLLERDASNSLKLARDERKIDRLDVTKRVPSSKNGKKESDTANHVQMTRGTQAGCQLISLHSESGEMFQSSSSILDLTVVSDDAEETITEKTSSQTSVTESEASS